MAFHRKLSAELESSPERSPMTPDSDSEGGIGEPSNSLRLKRINHARHIEDAGEEGKSFLPQDQRPGVLESYSKAEEKRVLKKLDRKLVLFMALLYMLSFLDRSSELPRNHPPYLAETDPRSRYWQCSNCWP